MTDEIAVAGSQKIADLLAVEAKLSEDEGELARRRLTLDEVRRARATLPPSVTNTPTFVVDGALVKAEHLNKGKSFKVRGTFALLAAEEACTSSALLSHSSGNAGIALALAGAAAGRLVHVVVPSNAPQSKARAIREAGAILHECGPTMAHRVEACARLAAAHPDWTMVEPHRTPTLMAGAGSVALEILEEQPDTTVIFVPIGGGVLASGVMAAAKLASDRRVRIVLAEPADGGRDDTFRALVSRKLEANGAVGEVDTIADGLRASLSILSFAHVMEFADEVIVVSNEEIRAAMLLLTEETRTLVEPSGAVAFAAYQRWRRSSDEATLAAARPAVVVSGGQVDLLQCPFFTGVKST